MSYIYTTIQKIGQYAFFFLRTMMNKSDKRSFYNYAKKNRIKIYFLFLI